MSAGISMIGILAILIVVGVIVAVIVASGRSKGGSDTPKPPAPNPREDLSNFSRQAGDDKEGRQG